MFLVSLSPLLQKAWELATTIICGSRGYKLKPSNFSFLGKTTKPVSEHFTYIVCLYQRISKAAVLVGFSSYDTIKNYDTIKTVDF